MSLFAEGKFFNKASAESGGGGDQHNLGWYATQSALETAHPTAVDGDWAIVGSTDTVWVWDSDTNAWKDTDQKGQVTSVNGQTGDVVLDLLPDQTGQSGKFLMTNGTNASWGNALADKSNSADSLVVSNKTPTFTGTAVYRNIFIVSGDNFSVSNYVQDNVYLVPVMNSNYSINGSYSVVIGSDIYGNNQKQRCVFIGTSTGSSGFLTQGSVCVGYGARVGAQYAIQLNASAQLATNSDANTFKVANANGNFELMSADGTIPKERLVNAVSIPSTMPELTVAGWSNNTQTVTATGVTATNTVFVSPAPASASDYASAGIICTAQGTDSLTFTCTTVPANAITVNVVIMG